MTSSRNFIRVQTNTAIALQNNTSMVPPVTYSNRGVANVWQLNFKVPKAQGLPQDKVYLLTMDAIAGWLSRT